MLQEGDFAPLCAIAWMAARGARARDLQLTLRDVDSDGLDVGTTLAVGIGCNPIEPCAGSATRVQNAQRRRPSSVEVVDGAADRIPHDAAAMAGAALA